jgi:hypothetical protein
MPARQKAEEVCGRLVVCGMDGFGRKLGRLGICDNEALKKRPTSASAFALLSKGHWSANLTVPRASLSPYGVSFYLPLTI